MENNIKEQGEVAKGEGCLRSFLIISAAFGLITGCMVLLKKLILG